MQKYPKEQFFLADTLDIRTDPKGCQEEKSKKQKQEKEDKNEKESLG